ncbi:MAG: hypothetical protein HQL15_01970, partial [Candidatus Omnitrophica bacterium]|nr:hypothetical protein [Candidatus Omnitrophota bacterium]
MILKSLVGTLALLIVYGLILDYIPKQWRNGVNFKQSRTIACENYLLLKTVPEVVIVGSSMSTVSSNIQLNLPKDRYYNLALTGGCSLTGVLLIDQSRLYPKLLLVEINRLIDKELDRDFLLTVNNPLMRLFKYSFPVFREENQL